MKAQQAMIPNVELVAPDSTAMAAARLMRDLDVGALPVAHEDRLVGMVTDRDLVVRGLAARDLYRLRTPTMTHADCARRCITATAPRRVSG